MATGNWGNRERDIASALIIRHSRDFQTAKENKLKKTSQKEMCGMLLHRPHIDQTLSAAKNFTPQSGRGQLQN